LGETTNHATRDTRYERSGASVAGVELGFRSDKEKNSALGGSFDPGPRDESLVDFGIVLALRKGTLYWRR